MQTPEIQIVLRQLGDRSQASCAIPLPGGREQTFAETGPSGAAALDALLRKKLSASHAGAAFCVPGTRLRGLVPPKPCKPRKPALRKGAA
jgi:hypothetical protein